MKNLYLVLLSLFVVSVGKSQNVPIDFESGGHGASWTWTVFENDVNPSLNIVANPDPTGANTSATVAEFTALQAGQPWAGCESMHGADIGTFALSASTSTIRVMVWKPEISDVGVKLVDATGWSLGEIKVANTVVNQWEELEFDFTASVGITYDQIVIFPDFQPRSGDNVCYFDNISFGPQSVGPAPTVAAPTPTIDDSLVISMFSDAYTNVPVDTWQAPWSVGSLSDVMIAGDSTKLVIGLDFLGIEAVGANSIDATAMETFHVDVWSGDFTEFRVKLVDFGPDNAFGGNDDTEHEVTFSSPNQEEWISYAIPLSDFTSLAARDHLSQFILSATPAGGSTVYFDNMYFSRSPVIGIEEFQTTSVKLFPNPSNGLFQITSDQVLQDVRIFNLMGAEVLRVQPTTNPVSLDLSHLPVGSYVVKSTSEEGTAVNKFIRK